MDPVYGPPMPWWLPFQNFFGELPICQLDHFDLLWWIR